MTDKKVQERERQLRKEAKRRKKEFWDEVWRIAFLVLMGAFVIWMIFTVISNHV